MLPMTSTSREALRTVLRVGALLFVAFLTYAAGRYDASKLDVSRFVADSARRDLTFSEDHDLLVRINDRVTAMYCGHLTPAQQAGCQ